jgi:rhodanese-related sulfurtransferase
MTRLIEKKTVLLKNPTFFLLLLWLIAGCSGGDAPEDDTAPRERASVRTISPGQAAALLEKHQDMVILDVRSVSELREGSIQGSMLTPFWSLAQGTMELPGDRPILLVCAVGGRSYAAGQLLVRNGFREVYNLRGGIVAWKHSGLPVIHYRVSKF